MDITVKKDIINYAENILNALKDMGSHKELNISKIRQEILLILEKTIYFYVESHDFDLWAKNNLEKALSYFRWNIGRSQSPVSMLQECLRCIKQSALEEKQRSAFYQHDKKRQEVIEKLQQDDFIEFINELKKHC